jgi:hypothetical protein
MTKRREGAVIVGDAIVFPSKCQVGRDFGNTMRKER